LAGRAVSSHNKDLRYVLLRIGPDGHPTL
jgi:hypothetical protein